MYPLIIKLITGWSGLFEKILIEYRLPLLDTFQDKINILKGLNHPSIVKIFDSCAQRNEEYSDTFAEFWIVMEYIEGSTLETLISTTEFSISEVIKWAIRVCDVLDYLHNQQPHPVLVHPIQPSHIMINHKRDATLIDFGFGNYTGQRFPDGYVAPDQYKGNVTPISDIYSLGATLHHVLTRIAPRMYPPFSFRERPIKQYNPDVPNALVSVIEKSVQFDPKDRWQSAAEMKTALESL
jgi:serine/threonine protein kinase